MKDIKVIKEELQAFGIKYRACEEGLEEIKGNTLTELFGNIGKFIYWCKNSNKKGIEFNSIFDNKLVIEDGVLLCNCTNLESIIMSDSLTSIGDFAFQNCRGLTSITIPDSVTSIGDCAFAYCIGLTSVIIPDLVTSIGDYAFADCHELTSVEIPNSVTVIEDDAFYNCNPELEIIRR